ncbi:glycosyltransferase involved in cell wall biosynthesis [Rhodoblastus sphagnicola]|nr:glycoside hydrolase family 99-like domain-containing protein [Rhodoblastus sphagnicola]MBB4198752.1 glycosyltransferase involved in cell wall biosynthesis [Rhodoblastus sphagnicola]
MRGWVEKIENGVIEGWIIGDDQAVPVEIALLVDNQKVSEGVASLFREDLIGGASQTGLAGFSLSFGVDQLSSKQCVVRVVEKNSGWEVPPGPIEFDPRKDNSDPQIEGAIDFLTPWGVSGWARCAHIGAEAARIEVILNGVVICEGLARAPRPDLQFHAASANCGFSLRFEKLLPTDVALTIRAVSSTTTKILYNGKPENVEGYVDSVEKWGASGWAWSPRNASAPLKVEARVAERVVATAVANQYRDDIRQSGRGAGYSGFTLKFDPPLSSGDAPEFFATWNTETVRLAAADLTGPVIATPTQKVETETRSTLSLDIEGSVDVVTCWLASGWVWRPSAPDQALEVEAILSGKVIGQTVADQPRPDLAEHGKGTGRYGFVLSFSSPLQDETPPVFRVVGPEGAVVIANTNKVQLSHDRPVEESPGEEAQPDTPTLLPVVEGHVDHMTRREAVGWAWFPSAPEQTAQVEVILDGKVIGRALADQPRPDLAQHGKGTGLYGFDIKFDEAVTGAETPEFRALPSLGRLLINEKSLPPVSPNDLIKRSTGSFSALYDEHAGFTTKGPLFEEFDDTILAGVSEGESDKPKPMLIAFYLPQFHAIEENDLFWGKGFTEWRQLPKGVPRFPGHYQPRIPRDLGFYNLENVEDLRKQVAMAKAGGVSGFAYYYYWFNRKRVLERPLELLLQSDVDMPFMLIWANENWTRTWDGSESQVLLGQNYRAEDEDALIDDFARHLRDHRYIRLNNRPLLVIYNPKNVPDSAVTIKRWREKLTARLDVEPLLFMAQTFGETDPSIHGLDGALEFPPHKLSNHLPGRPTPDAYSAEFAGRVIAYDDFAKASLEEDEPEDYPLIKTIVPSWDNDCRRPNRGLTLEGIAPKKYEKWLTELVNRAIDTPIHGTPIVAINAWNEWAESAYLEPDVHYGAAFLNATARAYVSAVNARARRAPQEEVGFGARPRVSVIFPNYNHSRFLPERLGSVLDQTLQPDEIIFLDDCSSDDSVEVARKILGRSPIPHQIVVNEKNSGGVFRQWLKGLSLAKYDLIWVAETDDSADRRFLSNILPAFARDDVMAAFGRITCIDPDGAPRKDLDGYFDAMENFSWGVSCVVPAFKAFSHDFAIRNVIPNASGLVFRKPSLTEEEQERLLQYRFAGDWYFYALVVRGGAIAYSRRARSFFRVNPSSASRSSFFTDRHLAEHMMVVDDLRSLYAIDDAAVAAHSDMLAQYLPERDAEDVRQGFLERAREAAKSPLRVCIGANGFTVGGGEILPIDLANALKARGLHVTYLVVERPADERGNSVRRRLRADIPVVYWDDVCDDFNGFISAHGIQLINSHNVSLDFRLYCRHVDLKIPYLASLHGGFETVQDLMSEDFLAFLGRTVSKWLYLSEKNLNFLPQALRDPVKLVYSFNAVAPFDGEWVDRKAFRAQHAIAEDAFVFVICSRAIESKGWRTAIEIVEGLGKCVDRPTHLVLIGDGPIAAELKAEYEEAPFVTFLGQIDRPIRYFPCFDMGLFPSIFEGETFPLFLLECFQTGLPVAATDIGEIPRMVQEKESEAGGIVIDRLGNRDLLAKAFVEAIQQMFSSAVAYETFIRGALAASERFSVNALGDLYVTTFRSTAHAEQGIQADE